MAMRYYLASEYGRRVLFRDSSQNADGFQKIKVFGRKLLI